MFRIKICGITSVADALMAVEAGADAIGLNFYPRSPRFVTLPLAREIVAAIGDSTAKVGLFVNVPAAEAMTAARDLALDMLQFHGDEPPGYLTDFSGFPLMKAFRIGSEGLAPVQAYLELCRPLGGKLQAVLFDAQIAGAYGGTGRTAPWEIAAAYVAAAAPSPLVLAGGLTPENVADAIRAVRPSAVDTASGVEQAPGRKDAGRVRAFVQAAAEAFASGQ